IDFWYSAILPEVFYSNRFLFYSNTFILFEQKLILFEQRSDSPFFLLALVVFL
ncbi:hypothetical protein GIB67_024564, partial [Kingdonia uniflora]